VQLTSGGANTYYSTPALLSSPVGVFAAWSENTGNGSLEDPSGASVIRLARLSDGGAVVGAIERLQAPVIDVDNIGPTLAFHDGALAVAWSRGTIIYVCGGCVPDHDLELVLLDPTDLVPLADRITFQGTVGLLNAALAVDASGELVGLLDHTYHAWSEGAAVRASCGPR
jgi:hypothetical protein